jgi:uncharacterized protein (TIGR00297 family)
MTARVTLGFAVAVAIAMYARHRGALSSGGAFAASALGTIAAAAGVRWGILLIGYFLMAVALSHWRRFEKAARTMAIVEKRGPRDAWQVFANGLVYVLAALYAATATSDALAAAALGALAASMADTAATEVGSAVGGEPRSILSGQKVAAGLSGGVTAVGTLAMLVAGAAIATFALLLGFGVRAAVAGFAGAMAGALADSLLGALLQERRRCTLCGALTERRVHSCRAAAATAVVGGIQGFDNDWVNLTSTLIGALVAGVSSRGGF